MVAISLAPLPKWHVQCLDAVASWKIPPREARLIKFRNEPCRNIHRIDGLGCGVAEMQPHAYQGQIRHTPGQPDIGRRTQLDGTLTNTSLYPTSSAFHPHNAVTLPSTASRATYTYIGYDVPFYRIMIIYMNSYTILAFASTTPYMSG